MIRLNKASIDLIKEFEGWRPNAYICPAGKWTIGYGHTAMAGPPAPKKGMKITLAEGEELLQKDLQQYIRAVKQCVKVPLNENQLGALASFTYNIGIGGFKRSSALKVLNEGNYSAVPARMSLWNKVTVNGRKKTLKGLVRRRDAEGRLFLKDPVTSPTLVKLAATDRTSTTEIAAGLGVVSTITASGREVIENLAGLQIPMWFVWALVLLILGSLFWIWKERRDYKKDATKEIEDV